VLITIDPNELLVTSATLHSCATEAADIGSQLRGCACCSMPPDLQAAVDALVVTTDRALDAVAARIDVQANDLVNRAQIAASDSLATAGVLTEAPAAAVSIGNDSLLNLSELSPSTGTSKIVIGGSTFGGDMTVTVPTLVQPAEGASFGYNPLNLSELSPSSGTSTIVIGPQDLSGTTYGPWVDLLDRVQRHQTIISSVVNDSMSGTLDAARIIGHMNDDIVGTILASPRSDWETYMGRPMSDSEIRSKDPHILLA